MSDIDRRDFVKQTTVAGLGILAAPIIGRGQSPNETVRIAVCGVNGRGIVHAQNFSRIANSEVAYICDVDANVIKKGLDGTKGQARTPRTVTACLIGAARSKSISATKAGSTSAGWARHLALVRCRSRGSEHVPSRASTRRMLAHRAGHRAGRPRPA